MSECLEVCYSKFRCLTRVKPPRKIYRKGGLVSMDSQHERHEDYLYLPIRLLQWTGH